MHDEIKAIFLDIDYTLYSHKAGCVPASAWAALEKLKEKGIKVFIATGRQYYEMFRLDVDWAFFDGFVTLNGALNLDGKRNIISSHPIEGKARDGLEALFHHEDFSLIVVEEERMFANHYSDEVYTALTYISTSLPPLGQLSGKPVYQLVFYGQGPLEEKVMPLLPGCTASRWNDYAFDVTVSSTGKDKGVADMMTSFGWKSDECLVFGDGDNDISMLREIKHSVAMGNARDHIKEVAEYVTSDIDDDGIARALKYYGLI